MFDALPDRPSAVDTCAEALRRTILAQSMTPGDRLPPERALAADLGVDRTTLRAALGQLVRDGLLAVRQGSGYRVLDYPRTGGPGLVPALVARAKRSGDRRRIWVDLLAVRRCLAGALIEALVEAQPIDEAALQPIEQAIDALQAAAASGTGPGSVAAADLEVVRAWVAASDTEVLGLFVNPVLQILEGLPELCGAMYADPAANVAAWRWMLQGARRGDLTTEGVSALLRQRDQLTLDHLEST